jgi:hypothetical protein
MKIIYYIKEYQKVKLKKEIYNQYDWKVSKIANDFTLVDAWELPIYIKTSKNVTLKKVCDIILQGMSGKRNIYKLTTLLHKIRRVLGVQLGWDNDVNSLPIPGCREKSVRERMFLKENKIEKYKLNNIEFNIVYNNENELLMELSNNTVHGMLHFCWIDETIRNKKVRMAAFVKTRGALGKIYMAIIKPFRVFIVYPALMISSKENWDQFCLPQE